MRLEYEELSKLEGAVGEFQRWRARVAVAEGRASSAEEIAGTRRGLNRAVAGVERAAMVLSLSDTVFEKGVALREEADRRGIDLEGGS